MYCWFNSYFVFKKEKKIEFSLICSFYSCLGTERWATEITQKFAISGLVGYERVAYQKIYCKNTKINFNWFSVFAASKFIEL